MQVMFSDCPGDHVNVIAASPVRGHHGVPVLTREQAEDSMSIPGDFNMDAETSTPLLREAPAVILEASSESRVRCFVCLRQPARRQAHPLRLHAVNKSRANKPCASSNTYG